MLTKIKEKYDSLDIRNKAWVLTASVLLFFVVVLALMLQFPLFFGVGLVLFAFGVSAWCVHLNIVEILHNRENKKK